MQLKALNLYAEYQ